MKIRVILIIFLFYASYFVIAQKSTVKNNTLYFLSEIYNEGKKNTLVKDRAHLVFDLKLNNATCFTSCNFMKLKYTLKGNSLLFNSVNPDKEPCPDPMIGLEEDFKTCFPKVNNYVLSGNTLVLFNNKDTLMVFYEKPMQNRK